MDEKYIIIGSKADLRPPDISKIYPSSRSY